MNEQEIKDYICKNLILSGEVRDHVLHLSLYLNHDLVDYTTIPLPDDRDYSSFSAPG